MVLVGSFRGTCSFFFFRDVFGLVGSVLESCDVIVILCGC